MLRISPVCLELNSHGIRFNSEAVKITGGKARKPTEQKLTSLQTIPKRLFRTQKMGPHRKKDAFSLL